jgi:predicted PhzF superfamily epimerase YddE/YHI9
MMLYQVDAFTATPFSGNPAAVCVLPAPRPDPWMQQVAREMNLSETAFLTRRSGGFGLRWFTPAVEVDLCGHATLASAHVLWEAGLLAPDEEARFHTRSGVLTARREAEWIVMDFPSEPPAALPAAPALCEALGVAAVYVGRNRMDYLVRVESAEAVRALAPDMGALASVDARGVIVTAPADEPGYDFVSRFFAPCVGIPEDPVTGSAHCALGPYWGEQLQKTSLLGYQASARGGTVRVHLRGGRVDLAGQAVTVMRMELLV